MARPSETWRHLAQQLGRMSADDPYERCGLLMSRRGVLSLREVDNTHAEPATRFALNYVALLNALAVEEPVVGFLHTHPGRTMANTDPSPEDCSGAAQYLLYIHAMYHPYSRALTIYNSAGAVVRFRIR